MLVPILVGRQSQRRRSTEISALLARMAYPYVVLRHVPVQGSPAWYEGSFQQAAYWALSNDGGSTFGPARLIQSSPTGPLWGPNIHVQGDMVYMIFSGTSPPQCQVGPHP